MALTARLSGPRLTEPFFRTSTRTISTALQAWSSRSLLTASITLPAITINVPDLVSDIWEGLLRAVPKKKTSHMKKRHRQLAGKALKDVKAVNSCPGCGRPKKAHTLCPYCVAGPSDIRVWSQNTDRNLEIYESWNTRDLEAKQTAKLADESRDTGIEEQRISEEDKEK